MNKRFFLGLSALVLGTAILAGCSINLHPRESTVMTTVPTTRTTSSQATTALPTSSALPSTTATASSTSTAAVATTSAHTTTAPRITATTPVRTTTSPTTTSAAGDPVVGSSILDGFRADKAKPWLILQAWPSEYAAKGLGDNPSYPVFNLSHPSVAEANNHMRDLAKELYEETQSSDFEPTHLEANVIVEENASGISCMLRIVADVPNQESITYHLTTFHFAHEDGALLSAQDFIKRSGIGFADYYNIDAALYDLSVGIHGEDTHQRTLDTTFIQLNVGFWEPFLADSPFEPLAFPGPEEGVAFYMPYLFEDYHFDTYAYFVTWPGDDLIYGESSLFYESLSDPDKAMAGAFLGYASEQAYPEHDALANSFSSLIHRTDPPLYPYFAYTGGDELFLLATRYRFALLEVTELSAPDAQGRQQEDRTQSEYYVHAILLRSNPSDLFPNARVRVVVCGEVVSVLDPSVDQATGSLNIPENMDVLDLQPFVETSGTPELEPEWYEYLGSGMQEG